MEMNCFFSRLERFDACVVLASQVYALFLGILAGTQFKLILSRVRETLPAAMWSSWRFWPFVHLVSDSELILETDLGICL